MLGTSINAPHAGCDARKQTHGLHPIQSTHPMRGATSKAHAPVSTFQSNAPRAGCNRSTYVSFQRINSFQSNAPRAGCNSKTIQSKRILVARRMYSFANYVLHTLKHSPIYCIGTTLYLVLFGAKLPAILCSLKVRTISITLL